MQRKRLEGRSAFPERFFTTEFRSLTSVVEKMIAVL